MPDITLSLESRAGQHAPGETALPPLHQCTHACTHLRHDGALPASVPRISLTGQRPGVVNREQNRPQTAGGQGDTGRGGCTKAVSAKLARQRKAQLIGRERASLFWHCSVALTGHTHGTCVLTENSLSMQDAWHRYLVISPPRRTFFKWDSHFRCRRVEGSLFLLDSSEWSTSPPLLPWQRCIEGALDASRCVGPLLSSLWAPFTHLCSGAGTFAPAGVLAHQGCCKKQRRQ